MKGMQRGFTLLEMLVSIAVFSLMMIAIYYFFDSGRWMYLHAEKRANLQENGRLTMEAMEREMRMIGLGVPQGTRFGSEESWLPAIFSADVNAISFRGDVDNINSWVKAAVTDSSSAQTIPVEYPLFVCPSNGNPIIIVERGKGWNPFTCTGPDDVNKTLSVTLEGGSTGHAYLPEEAEIFAPQHVFYRFTPDTDGDGVCDNTTDFTKCKIEKATRLSNIPQTAPFDDSAWQTFATNVEQVQFQYFVKDADDSPNELTTLPLAGNDLFIVDMIRLTLVVKDRAAVRGSGVKAGEYQDATFTTDILVRKRRY